MISSYFYHPESPEKIVDHNFVFLLIFQTLSAVLSKLILLGIAPVEIILGSVG